MFSIVYHTGEPMKKTKKNQGKLKQKLQKATLHLNPIETFVLRHLNTVTGLTDKQSFKALLCLALHTELKLWNETDAFKTAMISLADSNLVQAIEDLAQKYAEAMVNPAKEIDLKSEVLHD